jgi:hypothetical protein
MSMVNGKPFQSFYNADPGGGGGTPPNDPPADPPADPQNPPADPPPNNEPVTFTDTQQAQIDKIVNKTIAKERARAEEERKKAEEKAKLSAEAKAELERKEREDAVNKKEQQANERLINLEIKDVARELGVAAKKLDRFMKVIDRDDLVVDEDGNVDRSKVSAAVKAVLADMPEFKGGSTQGPGAEFGGGGNPGGAKYTLAQIQAMDAKAIAADYDEVQKSLKIHQTKK